MTAVHCSTKQLQERSKTAVILEDAVDRVPSGTKSEESKAANINAFALSPLSAANKATTSLHCEM